MLSSKTAICEVNCNLREVMRVLQIAIEFVGSQRLIRPGLRTLGSFGCSLHARGVMLNLGSGVWGLGSAALRFRSQARSPGDYRSLRVFASPGFADCGLRSLESDLFWILSAAILILVPGSWFLVPGSWFLVCYPFYSRYQLSVISYQLSVISYQLSATASSLLRAGLVAAKPTSLPLSRATYFRLQRLGRCSH